jgi:hypothetical protein
VIRLAALLAATALLSGCDPVGDACFNCVNAPADAPIGAEQAVQLRLIHGGTLPAGARDVYYAEQCGIDCIQWIRFEIAEAHWQPLLTRLRRGAEARSMPGDGGGGPGQPIWWRYEPDAATEQVALTGPQGWPLTVTGYLVRPGRIRAYLVANQK